MTRERTTADLLGYRPPTPGRVRRLLASAASTRPVSRVLARTLPGLDRALARGTGGRASAPGIVVGLPTVVLRTVGARTGLVRETTLIPVPVGSDLAVIGSNFGGARTPAWVFNLRARPEAVLVHGRREVAVRARLLAGEERERALATARRTYRGYGSYQHRAAHRELCVFALEPLPRAGDDDGPG